MMKVIKFPKLEKKQVALLRVEFMTGKVLDESFKRYQLSDKDQLVYTIFQSLEKAQDYINQKKGKYLNIEYHVYYINNKEIYVEIHKD